MLLVSLLLVAVVVIAGCSGDDNQTVYQTVFDRATYRPDGTRLAFESFGGNNLFYVYSIGSQGGGLTLLTPTDNDKDLTDEGGKMPSWAPNGTDMVMVGRRGAGGQALYLINPLVVTANPLLRLTDDTVAGMDSQPSWAPDSSKVIYTSNKSGVGHDTIWTVNRDGSGAAELYDPGTDAQWPVYSPDGTKIAFQKGVSAIGTDTSIVIINADGTNPVELGAGNGFRDEAPAWSPDGAALAFHTNRSGDFDIWTMNAADGLNLTRLTGDSRSDGFPVWNATVNRIAFTRDRELWTMAADGTDQKQLTRRY
jgi:Tol biopolymer transport system component